MLLIVPVVEPAFLHPVQRDVGVVEIQHDLARRTPMRLEEQIHQQRIDLRAIAVDPVILRRMAPRRVLQPIERALPGQRLAVGPQHRAQLAGQHRERRVLAQLVVIVEIFVAQRQAEDALPHQRRDPMLDVASVTPIDEAVGEAAHQPKAAIDLSQQQRTGVRGDVPAIEPGHHRTPRNRFKFEPLRRTLCRHRGIPRIVEKLLLHNASLRFAAPMHPPCLRNSG